MMMWIVVIGNYNQIFSFLRIGLIGEIGQYPDKGKGTIWWAYNSIRQLSFSF